MEYNFAQRVQGSSQVQAKNAEEAGKALQYFEKIFGKSTSKGSRDFGGDSNQGWVHFPSLKVGGCEINDAALELKGTDLVFDCAVSTPLLDMQSAARYIQSRAKTAEKLIEQFKKDVQKLIKDQEDDIKEDQKTLTFLHSLTK